MIDTKELRRLAQAAIAKMNASDPEFASSTPPLAILDLLDRLEAAEKERDDVAQQLVQSEVGKRKTSKECESYKAAYNDWADKTEWVQQGFNEGTISAKYLGMHRADVMARLLDEAAKERDALRAKVAAMEKQEPVAWLHESRRDSDVVTSAVKHVWQRDRPMSLAAYSIPLYLAPGAQGEKK